MLNNSITTFLFVLISLVLLRTCIGQETCTKANSTRLNPLLVNTTWSESGRLEICSCNSSNICTWSTIATAAVNDDTSGGWSWPNVQVACRQLANDTGVPYTGLGNPIYWSMAPNDSSVYSSVFTCDGTESNLTQCSQSSLSTSDITEVYVTCSKIVYTGHVKLSGSTTPHQGAVEVYVRSSGRWETVCVDNFHDAEADVACRTLGYASGRLAVLAINSFKGDQINTSPGISGVVCTGSERDIDSCFFTRSTACSRTNVLAGVTCTPSSSNTGTARLFTLSRWNNYKRVEVLFGGRWGSVCRNSWDHTDGLVTCQSLNRPTEDTEIPTNFISIIASQRPIWVYGYHCNGTETNLTLCNLVNDYPVGYAPGCNHTHDAGLYCADLPSKGGLSGGAIAGIVLGTLFGTCCLCLVVAGIAFCVYIFICQEIDWDDCECDCGCFKSCTKSSSRRSTPSPPGSRRIRNDNDDVALSSFTTRRESLTEEERIVQDFERKQAEEAEKKKEELPDAEITKPAPPSYNDALTLEGVTTLPNYTPQDDDKPSDPLPYPETDTDPAYPPLISSNSSDV